MTNAEIKQQIRACEEVEDDLMELAKGVRDLAFKMDERKILIPPVMSKIIPLIQEALANVYDQQRIYILLSGMQEG